MKINQEIYNQYRDTPFKPDDIKNNQQYIFFGKKIKNPNMDEYANYVIDNTQESNPSKDKSHSYDIILSTSLDKSKHNNKAHDSFLNNNITNQSNFDTTKNSSKNDVNLNLKMSNNSYDEKGNEGYKNKNNNKKVIMSSNYQYYRNNNEEIENNANNDMAIDEDNENNFGGLYNKENYYNNNYLNEEDNIENYYNPFNNKKEKDENELPNNIENELENKKGKMPIITLTSFPQTKKNIVQKEGRFKKFINLFSFKKHQKQENENSKFDDVDDIINNEKAKLPLLEDNLKYTNDNFIEKEKKFNDVLNNTDKKIDLVLGAINSKKDKRNNSKDIEKLKSELNGNEDISQENKVYDNDNNKCFMVNAEPILNTDNKRDINDSSDEENNLGNSSEMIDIDKSSEYTLQTGTNIDQLIRKKSKFSPLLMGILLGSCALFYLIYKKLKLKEILLKASDLIKKIPEFFKFILSYFSEGFEDFMERYNDIYRLLVGIISIICFWFIFKLLIRKLFKRQKK